MKILQLVTSRQFRGAEVFAATLSEELIKHNVEVLFVGLYEPPQTPLTVSNAVNLDLNGVKKFLSRDLLNKVVHLLRVHKPDIIQANGSDTLKYAVLARMLLNGKTPIIYRNISMVSAWIGNSFVKKTFYKFLFSRVDFVTSVGEESVSDLINCLDYPASKTKVIRRGIPLKQISKTESRDFVRQMLQFPESVKLVVHAGNYSVEKNHEFLLQVFSLMRSTAPHIKLLLIGDGERFGLIKELISAQDLNETVFQLGFRSDISTFLSGADLFVLCSKVEGIPGVILEAAVQQTPALAIDVGGVKEVVVNNVTGVVQNSFDAGQFAKHIVELLEDEHTIRQLGKNALSFAREHFDPKTNTVMFLELYRHLITTRK